MPEDTVAAKRPISEKRGMRKELAFVLLLVGLIIVAFGGLEHAVLKIPVMQHTSIIIGAVGGSSR
ncbi:MAG: hypothetical protein KGO05_14430 [Chloroflexota bacterium]|nr:hypothetical protein [Chloroflexota bacterium]